MHAAGWRSAVLASLNDIDDRCEAYLSTLDKAKRNRASFLAELRSATSTAGIILSTTGVGPTAIGIIEAAFGLAESSLDNYYSRLILEVEEGTVQNLVLKRQTAYRTLLQDQYMIYIRSKPAAFYAVRGYLRICLPSTIEARINSTLDSIVYLNEGRPVRTSGAHYYTKGGGYLDPVMSGATPTVDPDLESLRALVQ
ncbi:hypothetical protein GIW81_09460 [Hyphomicrobium sp. xq]|uniref:Uncharacterized protein n=1 Tax=Hyphomicrobium album TaxID=2665159 RepID=A0A6I3KLE9_9HYPH|nr:hypothetical protein [Hyphomicrobium album]MTD94557.1 hypothetical protein [Hyphomicrobium album]